MIPSDYLPSHAPTSPRRPRRTSLPRFEPGHRTPAAFRERRRLRRLRARDRLRPGTLAAEDGQALRPGVHPPPAPPAEEAAAGAVGQASEANRVPRALV